MPPARVRELVHAIASTYREEPVLSTATERATPLISELLSFDELRSYGVPRKGHHIKSSVWLYFDTDIGVLVGRHPKNQVVPVHDHGSWELVTPWRGRIDYHAYRRAETDDRPGHAPLELTDERVLIPGDLEIVDRPPGDIHGWTVLDDDTWLFAITGPDISDVRRYYDVASSTYEERRTNAADEEGA